jgi:23S rRNA pseudouridine955/2504/2580 synthase
MQRHLSMQFEHRKVTKTYHAIVEGKIEFNQLLVDLPINTSDLNRIRIDHKNGKSAQTAFKSIELFNRFTLMECKPKTGRLHQIRVHLASQNARISADEKYGGRIPLLSHIKRKISGEDRPLINRFALHAKSISFDDLSNNSVTTDCPYPKDYEVFLKLLRKYGS